MRLGNARLGSRSSRLGAGAAAATTSGPTYIDYAFRLLEHALSYWADRSSDNYLQPAPAAAIADPDVAGAIASTATVTIDRDETASIAGQPPAYIER